jgi:hypothetical protein
MPINSAGGSVLSKLKPERDKSGLRKSLTVVHRTDAPLLVIVSVHPAGESTFVGVSDRNPAPGIQLNQSVPIVVVPVLVRVIE